MEKAVSKGDLGKNNIDKFKKILGQNSIWLIFIVIVGFLGLLNKNFLTIINITNLLTTESINGILAIGIMFCILSKGIDLSAGSIVGLSAVVSASLVQEISSGKLLPGIGTMPPIVGLLAGIAVGTSFGAVNGLLIAYTKIPPFISTLGTQLVARALAMIYTNSYPVSKLSPGFKVIGQGSLLSKIPLINKIPILGTLPNVVLVFILIVIIGGFLLTQTRYGKSIYAIGGNEVAARVAGINVEKNLVLVYMFSAFCASLGGVLLASRTGSGIATLGVNYELDAIAAATVGGTSHSGGICRISGVIAGILLLGVINNGLLLLGVSPYVQQMIKGGIIVGAVVLDMRKNVRKA